MLSSGSPFSLHNDVLSATPSTNAEKSSLVEELKSRGRVSVTTQRYPDAKELYGKAIEVLSSMDEGTDADATKVIQNKKDLAIFHSNRALCSLQMNKADDSYDDATSATCFDPNYVKGYWRLGQSCMALKKTQEAIDAYTFALALGESKAIQKELVKAQKQLVKDKEEEERRQKEAEEKKEEANSNSAPVEKEKVPISTKSSSSLPPKSTSSASGDAKDSSSVKVKDSGEFGSSDHVRGYKIVNGKKTSFFHHEQTEEEKRLIGDITPQRIDINSDGNGAASSSSEPTRIDVDAKPADSDVSVWNKAGTWEEKDVTDWAIQSVTEQIMGASYCLPEGSPDPKASVKVTEISKLISSKKAGGSAHASVAKVRGKKKYIFELTICVHWEITLGNGQTCKGKMTFFDVDGTHQIGDGYDVLDYSMEAKSDFPADAKHLLDRFVRDGGLRTEVEKKLDGWIDIFRETY